MSTCIGQNGAVAALTLDVVIPITDDRVVGALVYIRHGLWGLRPTVVGELGWRIPVEPEEVTLTGMGLLAKAVTELETKGEAEKTEPAVVLKALAGPERTGVLRVANREVATHLGLGDRVRGRAKGGEAVLRNREHPVCCIEELGRLENHFDDMSVTMPARTARRIGMEKEDIHGWRRWVRDLTQDTNSIFTTKWLCLS